MMHTDDVFMVLLTSPKGKPSTQALSETSSSLQLLYT